MSTFVIVGGGVVGASAGYYLALKGAKPMVIEAGRPACSASGKAGGFLALDWSDGTPLEELVRTSFKMHKTLADSLDGVNRYGYRRVNTHQLTLRTKNSASTTLIPTTPKTLPDWVDAKAVQKASLLATSETTAQVHPKLFTEVLIEEMVSMGGSIQQGEVVGLEYTSDADPKVTGVKILKPDGDISSISAEGVILAMGAFSSKFNTIVKGLPCIQGLKVHSIVLKDEGVTTNDALFLHCRGPSGKSLEPEIYPRPDNTVYVCGCADEDATVPNSAFEVQPSSQEAIDTLKDIAKTVVPNLIEAEVLQEQACFLPCTEMDGLPVIGKVPEYEKLYIATGHSCWGILNAPATGLALAELIVEGRCSSIDLSFFSPSRFRI